MKYDPILERVREDEEREKKKTYSTARHAPSEQPEHVLVVYKHVL